jgi:hypothetical protein
MDRPFASKKDILIILSLFLIFLLFFFVIKLNQKEGSRVKISHNGKEIYNISLENLKDSATYMVDGAKIVADKNGVYVSDNDCPNKQCVKSGKISKTGESIVCVPKRIVIEITGKSITNPVTY